MTISEKDYLKERPYVLMGTGHRPKNYVEYKHYEESLHVLKNSIAKVVEEKEIEVSHVISGLALGFDTALAMYANENNIPLHAYIPFIGQEYMWSTNMQNTYQTLIKSAERIHIAHSKNIPDSRRNIVSALHQRNTAMLENTDLCLTFHRRDITTGGTVDAIKKAKANCIFTIPVWTEYQKQAAVAKIPIKKLDK